MSNLNLSLGNIINVTVLGAPSGLGLPNINTLCLFSSEAPISNAYDSADFVLYKSPAEVAVDFGSGSDAYAIALKVFGQNPNIMTTGGYLAICPRVDGTEAIGTACDRIKDQIYFFGILVDEDITGSDFTTLTAYMQTVDKVLFFGSATAADIVTTSGRFDVVRTSGQTHTRCIYYTVSQGAAVLVAAAYGARALSVAFDGSKTCSTMHLKGLTGCTADTGMTQTALAAAKAAGADTYVSIAGVAGVFCSGENVFFDEIYNELWIKLALQVAGFNYLRQTNTKIAQTEEGMDGLKNEFRKVCAQAVKNGFLAPGSWTSPDVFGSPEAMLRCIQDIGYYVYSAPISAQAQADREDRKAPLVQIAIKAAGAIHSSDIIVNVNA